jgi:hypothetical protein
MFVTTPLIILILSLLLASCVDHPTPEPLGTVRDSAGIALVDIPPDSDEGPVVTLAIDSAWGGAVDLEVGELTDVLITPDERLIFLDAVAARVYTRPASDETWTIFGRQGEGPGEFSSRGLLGPLLATDSSVLVPDLDLQRITEFSFEGEVLDVRPYPFMAYAVDWRPHRDGGLVFRSLDERGDALIHWAGSQIDTLYSFPIVVETHNLILQPWALWDFTPDGRLLSGRSDEGAIVLRGNGAQPSSRVIRFSISEDPIGAEEEAFLLDLAVESVRVNQPGCTEETLDAVRAATTLPERAPLLAGIMVSPGGDIWVHRAKPVLSMGLEALRIGSAAGYGGDRWDILNTEGLLRAQVRLPKGFSPRQFAGPWLYGVIEAPAGMDTPARVRVDLS